MSEQRKTAPDPRAAERGVIGPNAVTQLAAALRSCEGEAEVRAVFSAAGARDWLDRPPTVMVDERRVAKLHQTVRALLPRATAEAILRQAGLLTADYLLAARIPKPVQLLLKILPCRLSVRLLARAISFHAWTFAGTGGFSARAGSRTIFELRGNPFCRNENASAPACQWHSAVFERLFTRLVSPSITVRETACEAHGAPCCRHEVDLPAPSYRSDEARPTGREPFGA